MAARQQTGATGQIPETINAPLPAIETRPKWFQPRDTPDGVDHDPEKVKQIVRNFDPERFEALWVVKSPDSPSGYIVIAGHHRLAAARELKLGKVPIRVLEGDAASEEDRKRLLHKADVSNYLVSKPGLIEQVNTVRRMHGQDYSDRDISDAIRKRPSEIEKLRYLAAMPSDTLYYVSVNKEMRGIAETLGEARAKGWIDTEAASHLYKRTQEQFEETSKVPSKNALRQQLLDAHGKAQSRAAQPGRLAGFGENLVVAQVLDDAAVETKRQKDVADTTRRLTSCQLLAKDLGVSIDEVREAAQAKLDALDLTPAEVARARLVLTKDPTPGDSPAERELERIVTKAEKADAAAPSPANAPSAVNLFGEVQAIPAPDSDEVDQDGNEAPKTIAAQSTMGAGFETNQSLSMPMGEGRAAAAPLADPTTLKAAQERRMLQGQGQQDMLTESAAPQVDGPGNHPHEVKIVGLMQQTIDLKTGNVDVEPLTARSTNMDTLTVSRRGVESTEGKAVQGRGVSVNVTGDEVVAKRQGDGHVVNNATGENVADLPHPPANQADTLYQGHKGPGIGYLKPDRPNRRDGDGDTVVQERRPRKGDQYNPSPLPISERAKRPAAGGRQRDRLVAALTADAEKRARNGKPSGRRKKQPKLKTAPAGGGRTGGVVIRYA